MGRSADVKGALTRYRGGAATLEDEGGDLMDEGGIDMPDGWYSLEQLRKRGKTCRHAKALAAFVEGDDAISQIVISDGEATISFY